MPYEAGDYAGLDGGDIHLYFGYEVTVGDDEEWCFRARLGDDTIIIPESHFKARRTNDRPASLLLAGIEHLLDNGILIRNPAWTP